jgi:hypothetical protein
VQAHDRDAREAHQGAHDPAGAQALAEECRRAEDDQHRLQVHDRCARSRADGAQARGLEADERRLVRHAEDEHDRQPARAEPAQTAGQRQQQHRGDRGAPAAHPQRPRHLERDPLGDERRAPEHAQCRRQRAGLDSRLHLSARGGCDPRAARGRHGAAARVPGARAVTSSADHSASSTASPAAATFAVITGSSARGKERMTHGWAASSGRGPYAG